MEYMERILPMKYGLLFALLTLVYGFGLGGVFGAYEDSIKSHLKAEGQKVLSSAYGDDPGALKKVADKSWVYFKRAHLHANGLGTAAVSLILLLAFLPVSIPVKRLVALALGVGSLGYSLFWMWAGLKAPGLGGTGAAKEALQWLAIPSSGLCILGLLAVVAASLYSCFSTEARPAVTEATDRTAD